MDEDWASDGDDDGDLVDTSALPPIPDVQVPVSTSSISEPSPPPNAWANESADIRLATRLNAPPNHSAPNLSLPPKSRSGPPPRRDGLLRQTSSGPTSRNNNNMNNLPTRSFAGTGRSSSWGGTASNDVTFYVTNLPQTNERDISSFFSSHGIQPISVRITRHADSGNFKAAFVTVSQAQSQQGLSLDGSIYGTRTMHLKIDGADRDNRRNDRDRGGMGSVSYGGAFGGRDRRTQDDSNSGGRGWSSSAGANRSYGAQGSDIPSDRRYRNDRDNSRQNSRGGSATRDSYAKDSTIPTGPIPSGRKKLQLKPRTKPLPVLEVDQRAIDPPSSSGINTSSAPQVKETQPNDKEPQGEEKWEMAKDTGTSRTQVPRTNGGKKEEDSKRPVLLNTFAALEINDTDS